VHLVVVELGAPARHLALQKAQRLAESVQPGGDGVELAQAQQRIDH